MTIPQPCPRSEGAPPMCGIVGAIASRNVVPILTEGLKRLESQTDTEVVAHLIHHYFKAGGDLFAATRKAAADLHGAYALGVVALDDPETMTGARMGCPLVVGLGDGENFLASDLSAVIAETRRVIYLEDGDVVALKRSGVTVVDREGRPVERCEHLSELDAGAVDLGIHT